jgi:hypothetical protein
MGRVVGAARRTYAPCSIHAIARPGWDPSTPGTGDPNWRRTVPWLLHIQLAITAREG